MGGAQGRQAGQTRLEHRACSHRCCVGVGLAVGIPSSFQVAQGLRIGGIQHKVAQRLPHLQTLRIHLGQARSNALLGLDVTIELVLGVNQAAYAAGQPHHEQQGGHHRTQQEFAAEFHQVTSSGCYLCRW